MQSGATIQQAETIASTFGQAALQEGIAIYKKFTGKTYSTEDRKRLEILENHYKNYLKLKSSPVEWKLDEKSFEPTHCLKAGNWIEYVHQKQSAQQNAGNYSYQGRLLAAYVGIYMYTRNDRLTDKGKEGDLVEQFMSDWINFALNELPTYDYGQGGVERIENRLQYLDVVTKTKKLFEPGTFVRANNKQDVMQHIHEQLKSCKEFAVQENLRSSARDEFGKLRNNVRPLLNACAQILYYARGETKVYLEPLDLERFLYPEGFLTTKLSASIYPTVKESHAGTMLKEILQLAKVESMGTLVSRERELQGQEALLYFDEMGFAKDLDSHEVKFWNSKKFDSLPWVAKGKTEKREVKRMQEIGESILRVAHLKELVDMAHDLTGEVGDFWAYGDKKGKKSLEGLLHAYQKETDTLKKRVDEFYEYHDNQRRACNVTDKKLLSEVFNENLNLVDKQYDVVKQFYKESQANIAAIKEQMARYPVDAQKKINEKKRSFYRALNAYFHRFNPSSKADKYYVDIDEKEVGQVEPKKAESAMIHLVEQISVILSAKSDKYTNDAVAMMTQLVELLKLSLPEQAVAAAPTPVETPRGITKPSLALAPPVEKVKKRILKDEKGREIQFTLPLNSVSVRTKAINEKGMHDNAHYWYLDSDKFEPYIYKTPTEAKIQNKWKTGNKYSDWMNGYFTRNLERYEIYQSYAIAFKDALENPTTKSRIDHAKFNLVSYIDELRQKLDRERPRWRFKFGLWPIRTWGWPFNRAARQFTELLTAEFDRICLNINAEEAKANEWLHGRGMAKAARRVNVEECDARQVSPALTPSLQPSSAPSHSSLLTVDAGTTDKQVAQLLLKQRRSSAMDPNGYPVMPQTQRAKSNDGVPNARLAVPGGKVPLPTTINEELTPRRVVPKLSLVGVTSDSAVPSSRHSRRSSISAPGSPKTINFIQDEGSSSLSVDISTRLRGSSTPVAPRNR